MGHVSVTFDWYKGKSIWEDSSGPDKGGPDDSLREFRKHLGA